MGNYIFVQSLEIHYTNSNQMEPKLGMNRLHSQPDIHYKLIAIAITIPRMNTPPNTHIQAMAQLC